MEFRTEYNEHFLPHRVQGTHRTNQHFMLRPREQYFYRRKQL